MSFSQLNLPPAQVANLDSLGYKQMTPIQAEALPLALDGKDVIAQAKTGSGKTAVFALTILNKLRPRDFVVQALVLCPTRELGLQITSEIRRLARHQQNIKITTLYGGQPISLQKQSLKHGTHVVVGTPGRIKDHLEKGSLSFNNVNTLVLDEADRMLEMGFLPDIEAIISKVPANRQTLLFSATFPDNIQAISGKFQRNAIRIHVESQHRSEHIRQHFYTCPLDQKLEGLVTLLSHYQPPSAVVFCNFKQTTRDVCDFLIDHGYHALAINGDLEQREREETLIQFKQQSIHVLVATDVAARGLDIKELPAVINFELPSDPEIYVHRIGRTGRAGSTGLALTLCTERERTKLTTINEFQKTNIVAESVSTLKANAAMSDLPDFVTLCISGGRKDKIRAGEILGALTAGGDVAGTSVGKIDVTDYASYVAIKRDAADDAFERLKNGKIKGRSFRVQKL